MLHRNINLIPVLPENQLKTLVENRTVYNFNDCELNVFETHQQFDHVSLRFQNIVFTAMLRGKKVMHLFGTEEFDYFPGESVIIPAAEEMIIDFPEAEKDNPTQCLALEIDENKVKETLNKLNDKYPKVEQNDIWKVDMQQFHLKNSLEIVDTATRLIRTAADANPMRDILIDITLQELLVRLMQTQARNLIIDRYQERADNHRFAYVVKYIKQNLSEDLNIDKLSGMAYMSKSHFFRSFKNELGITPLEFIIKERIKHAKKLLSQPNYSVSDACYHSGFSNLTHFTILFKRYEGITPSLYKKRLFAA